MAIITLTTDWNKSDYYVGAVKGKILARDPAVRIIDISHQVQAFNIMQAAFVIRNCCYDFPKGTVHLIAVNAALSKKRDLLVIVNGGHYFVSSDNGIAGLICAEKPEKVYRVEDVKALNFLSLDVFIDTAFRIIQGEPLTKFCKETDTYEQQIPLRPVIEKNLISGSVIYIDSFSNAITNITEDTFKKVGQGRHFDIYIQSNHYKIDRLNSTYSDSVSGELLAIFNSVGLLEIAINHGNVADLLNLTINSAIRIKFYEEKPGSKLTLTGG